MNNKHFLNIYDTIAEYENKKTTEMNSAHIVYIKNSEKIIFQHKPFMEQYFTIEALENGTMEIEIPETYTSFKYSYNNDDWVETNEKVSLSVNITDTIRISCICEIFLTSYDDIIPCFTINFKHNVYGNIMSLLYGDDFIEQTSLKEECFYSLFLNDTNLISAENLILPATTLANYCYAYMFQSCTSLTTAPELPATTLASNCYGGMFHDCTSLTTAPELPATTLAENCYSYMFHGCTSLTTAPELLATKLASGCYNSMFNACTSLTTTPELPATKLATRCYNSMFNGCTSLTTAPELPATTLAASCYSNMFQGCTSLTTAPKLPATTLANYCYSSMFRGCTSLTTAPELPATTLAEYCYSYMLSNCSKLNYIKALFTTTPSNSYTSNWVSGVASNGTFVKNASATWNVTGTSGIPNGWTIETA